VLRVHLLRFHHKTRAKEEEQTEEGKEEEEGEGGEEAAAEAEELSRKDRGVDKERRLLKSNGSLQSSSI